MATAIKPVAHTVTLPQDPTLLDVLTLIGQPVTYQGSQWNVHSVEGPTWYAFNQDGQVTVDIDMSPTPGQPYAVIVPSGSKIGQGFTESVPLAKLRRGVCLTKPWA